jgi:tRNA1Val (adenine37-N6)-methyltransferase
MPHQKAQLRRDGFTFKAFFVAHDRCAMKVGTDGILLGAWSPVSRAKRVLDIGTGSGLVALMLAQRTTDAVVIDAVELDEQAAAQAQENGQATPWAARFHVHHADIRDWCAGQTARYDLIVSNPPFCAGRAMCDPGAGTGALYHDAGSRSAAGLCGVAYHRRRFLLRDPPGRRE